MSSGDGYEGGMSWAWMAAAMGRPLSARIESNEWEITEEVSVANLGGPFDEFIQLATERWQKGVDEYRGGDESIPFSGDPLLEGQEECADLYAYSKEALSQGLCSETESDQLNCFAFDAYKLIVRIRVANIKKQADADKRALRDEQARQAGLVVQEG